MDKNAASREDKLVRKPQEENKGIKKKRFLARLNLTDAQKEILRDINQTFHEGSFTLYGGCLELDSVGVVEVQKVNATTQNPHQAMYDLQGLDSVKKVDIFNVDEWLVVFHVA